MHRNSLFGTPVALIGSGCLKCIKQFISDYFTVFINNKILSQEFITQTWDVDWLWLFEMTRTVIFSDYFMVFIKNKMLSQEYLTYLRCVKHVYIGVSNTDIKIYISSYNTCGVDWLWLSPCSSLCSISSLLRAALTVSSSPGLPSSQSSSRREVSRICR